MSDCVTTRIVKRVAELEGVDPVELRPPLYEVIDPESLDSLFAAASAPGRSETLTVEFEYCEYRVAVDADGTIDVHPTTAVGSGIGRGDGNSTD